MNDNLELDQRLRELGAEIHPPAVPLADDLARGRSRVRRRRVLAAAGTAVAVVAIGLVGTVGPELVSADDRPGYSGGDGTPLPGPETTPPVRPGEKEVVPQVPKGQETFPAPLDSGDYAGNETLRLYRDVLAEHLDPQGRHLQKKVTGMQGGGGSLGSRFGWRNPGEDGLGMIVISVNGGWQATGWECGMPQVDITCRDITAPGGLEGQVAERGGAVDVAVEHPDGTVVIVSKENLFGNNSTVPVSAIDLTVEELAAAAADDRLKLPGYQGDAPELLSQQDLTTVGLEKLIGPGETYEKGYAGNDISPWQQGQWSDGTSSGELFLDALAIERPTGEYGCLKVQFTRCVVRTVDGKDVMVGYVRNKWGGGTQVIYAGPVYEIRVVFEPDQAGDEFPIDRAARFVVDDRWQP
jgi:hypothetical protein